MHTYTHNVTYIHTYIHTYILVQEDLLLVQGRTHVSCTRGKCDCCARPKVLPLHNRTIVLLYKTRVLFPDKKKILYKKTIFFLHKKKPLSCARR